MRRYSAYGLTIHSEIDLVDFPSAPEVGGADVVIRYGEIPKTVAKTALNEELVKIRDIGEFYIVEGREITVKLLPGAPPDIVRVLLSARMLAYLLRQRGWLPLHASSVWIADHAVLFLGRVGEGKSTTAAAFHRHGYPVVADDVAPVRVRDGVTELCSGPPQLRLCSDAAETFLELDPSARQVYDKHSLNLHRGGIPPTLPVARIYLLGEGESTQCLPATAIDAWATMARECFIRLRHAGADLLASHMRDCAAVLGATPVRHLSRPRDLGGIGKMVEAVERDLGNAQAEPRQGRRNSRNMAARYI